VPQLQLLRSFPAGRSSLLEPLGEGFLSRFLDRYGEGLHHITFKTDDIREAKEYLQPSNIEELLG
jgi:hypothetical protein